jgi:hypothetical protein
MYAVRVGTCGWSYADWKSVFYPKGLPAGEYLSYYAERFNVVEVDSTFYRSPGAKMVQGWKDRLTAAGFNVKAGTFGRPYRVPAQDGCLSHFAREVKHKPLQPLLRSRTKRTLLSTKTVSQARRDRSAADQCPEAAAMLVK